MFAFEVRERSLSGFDAVSLAESQQMMRRRNCIFATAAIIVVFVIGLSVFRLR